MMRFIFLCFSFLCCLGLQAQDTTRFFFESGQYKLNKEEQKRLNDIGRAYKWNDLDSIQFVGMADTVGKLEDNLKLSEKRAKYVSKRIKEFLPDSLPFSVFATGEKVQGSQSIENQRTVEIIFYKIIQEKEEQTVIDSSLNQCFYVDYNLLSQVYIDTLIKRSKSYVKVVRPAYKELNRSEKHYYGLKEGEAFIYKRLKWRYELNGLKWWKKRRLVTLIPLESFRKFKIFQIVYSKDDCSYCNENFQEYSTIKNVASKIQEDQFLMKNFQFKSPLFQKDVLMLRTPKEYLKDSLNYYLDLQSKQKVEWTIKSQKRPYAYAKIKKPEYVYDLSLNRSMDYCATPTDSTLANGKDGVSAPVAYVNTEFEGFELGKPNFSLESKNYFSNQSYHLIGLVLSGYRKKSMYTAGFYFSDQMELYPSLYYKYRLFGFNMAQLNSSSWKTIDRRYSTVSELQTYVGVDLMYNHTNHNSFLANANLGLAYVNIERRLPSRLFLQFNYHLFERNTIEYSLELGMRVSF